MANAKTAGLGTNPGINLSSYRALAVLLPAMLFCLLSLGGCHKPTMRELSEGRRIEIEAMQEEFLKISELFPIEQEINETENPLEPELYYHVADGLSNTAIVSRDDLLYWNHTPNKDDYFNLYSGSHFRQILDDSYMSEPANPEFAAEFQAALDLRYLIIYDSPGFSDAMLMVEAEDGKQGFASDPLKIVLTLYDRVQQKFLLVKFFTIEAPENLKVRGGNGSLEERMESAARSWYRARVEEQIAELIQERTGGTVEFNRAEFRRDGTREGAGEMVL